MRKISELTIKEISKICDHTFLMPPQAYKAPAQNAIFSRRQAFNAFISESLLLNPYAICVRAEDVLMAKKLLEKHNSKIKIAATVGFPDGSWHSTMYKIAQSQVALKEGAQEIDMVINYGKTLNYQQIFDDVNRVNSLVKQINPKAILKVILQTSEIYVQQPEEKQKLLKYIKICKQASVDFIKTSTGFSTKGAEVHSLKIMRQNFDKGVKISGGVNQQNMHELLEATSGQENGRIDLDPMKIRIGQSSLLKVTS